MSGEQLNLRMPGELAQRVRVRAAELGVRPRDVVVEALEAHFNGATASADAGKTGEPPNASGSPVDGRRTGATPVSPAIAGQTTIPVEEPESRGCPECGGDMLEGDAGMWACEGCGHLVQS